MKQKLTELLTPITIGIGLTTAISPIMGGVIIGSKLILDGGQGNHKEGVFMLPIIPSLGIQYGLCSLAQNKFIHPSSIDSLSEFFINPYVSQGLEYVSKMF